MKATLRAYNPNVDFMRVRQFLIDTFALYGRPCNWCIDRWEFARHFVLPVHNYYNVRYFGLPIEPRHWFRDERPGWESTIGVWENETGEMVGVVNSENEEAGEAWIQTHPDYAHLYDEMLTYAEQNLAVWVDGLGFIKVYVNEDSRLRDAVSARGYRKLNDVSVHKERVLGDLPAPELPDGYSIRSVADEDDVDKRRIAYSIAFGGRFNPLDWAPASAFLELQRAPSYRKDLDLFVVAPDGNYAAVTTIWLDEQNKYANFEPVATHVDYQRMGLGRALLHEGFCRMKACGAERSFMDAANDFYRKMGFKPTPYSYAPWIKYLEP